MAIDPSAAFRKALHEQLPHAAVSVDPFHLVRLANDTVTQVRQRVIRETKGRRGRLEDPAWVNRRLLLRAGNTLSLRALARLRAAIGDPASRRQGPGISVFAERCKQTFVHHVLPLKGALHGYW